MRPLRVLSYAMVMQALWIFIGCCGDTFLITFGWNSLGVTHLDNSGRSPLEASGEDPIPAAAYGIRVNVDSQMIASARFSPLPTAYATSCPETYVYSNPDTVLALRIHALEAATGSRPREVTDDFIIMETASSSTNIKEKFLAIPEYVRMMNSKPQPFPQIDIIRTKNQERSSSIRFIVTMELSGGKTLADTTSPIDLI